MSNVTVNFSESLSTKIGRFIIEKGYQLADVCGLAINKMPFRTDVWGILYARPDVQPKKYCWGLFTSNPRKVLLGRLWLNNQGRNAILDGRWYFEVKGRQYADICTNLAKELKDKFKVNIHVELIDEEPELESRWNDYDY